MAMPTEVMPCHRLRSCNVGFPLAHYQPEVSQYKKVSSAFWCSFGVNLNAPAHPGRSEVERGFIAARSCSLRRGGGTRGHPGTPGADRPLSLGRKRFNAEMITILLTSSLWSSGFHRNIFKTTAFSEYSSSLLTGFASRYLFALSSFHIFI